MKLVTLILIFCLFSCNDSKRVPKDFLQPLQMQQILFDLFITDAYNSSVISNDASFKLQEQNKVAAEQVFKSYKITRTQFEKSYAFYLSHPDLLKPIADSMAVIATRRSEEKTLPTIPVIATNKDSLKKNFQNGYNRKDTSRKIRNR
jgi:Domain of unknown function (DUF4296)